MEDNELPDVSDFTRQEAFALESRLLARIGPAFELSGEDTAPKNLAAISAYVELIDALADTAIGRLEHPLVGAREIYSKLSASSPTERGRYAFEAATLSADALSGQQLVHYHVSTPEAERLADLFYALMYSNNAIQKWAGKAKLSFLSAVHRDVATIRSGRIADQPVEWNPFVSQDVFFEPLWHSEVPASCQVMISNWERQIAACGRSSRYAGISLPQRHSDVTLMSVRVFLCHSSADKGAVRELFRRLKTDGLDPWLDEENLLPGQDWRTEITKAVQSSTVVAVCLSASSVGKTGFVQREIRIALDAAEERPEGTTYIVPIRLEPCDVPDRLRSWHWVDLFDPSGYAKLLKALRMVAG